MSKQQRMTGVGWLAVGSALIATLGCTQTQAKAKPESPTKTVAVPRTTVTAASAKPAAKTVPKGPQAEVLNSAIRRVTVYSDRALVTRQATANLKTTPEVYAINKLPGWVDDGSVRVSTSSGRIVDVQVQRNYLARANDETYQQAEAQAQELANQMGALDDELKILGAQTKQIEDIKAFSMEKITKDTTVGTVSVDSYGKVVSFISESLRATAKERRVVQQKRSKLQPEITAIQKRLAELRSLTQLEETTVLVTLQGASAGNAIVELTYMLPGATWEPMHELRTSASAQKSVEVASFAVVTQTSGEDWNNAELSFSTQSSTEAVRIPELEALTLGDTKTATRMLKSQVSSFSRAKAAFDSQNGLWNKVQRKSSMQHNFEEVYQSNFDYLQVVQSKTVQIFQKLQKRGTTAHFKTAGRASVRGDGYSVRLPIGTAQLKTTQKIVAAPEQSLNAARTLETSNSSKQPLLPGNVALYQDGAFLGMTNIDFIAEGERFAMFLNVADHLKLSRVLDKKQSSVVRKKRTRMQVAFIVTVENLSDKATSLTLADRIPVSQNKAIVVDRVRVKPAGATPDSKGILRWDLTLKPKEKRSFQVQYRIEYPPTLILETERQRARPRRKNRQKRMDQPYELNEQIYDLENEL